MAAATCQWIDQNGCSGLQGVWNAWSRKTGIVVPFGSTVVFWLWLAYSLSFDTTGDTDRTRASCGQILYAFLLKPHTLSPMYDAWYATASHFENTALNRNSGSRA